MNYNITTADKIKIALSESLALIGYKMYKLCIESCEYTLDTLTCGMTKNLTVQIGPRNVQTGSRDTRLI